MGLLLSSPRSSALYSGRFGLHLDNYFRLFGGESLARGVILNIRFTFGELLGRGRRQGADSLSDIPITQLPNLPPPTSIDYGDFPGIL